MAKTKRPSTLLYSGKLEGKTYELRLTMEAIEKLQTHVGKKIQAFLGSFNEDVLGGFVTVVWAARQPFIEQGNKFTLDDAKALWDELIDEGNDIEDNSEILQGILIESGLMPHKQEVQEEDDEDSPKE